MLWPHKQISILEIEAGIAPPLGELYVDANDIPHLNMSAPFRFQLILFLANNQQIRVHTYGFP